MRLCTVQFNHGKDRRFEILLDVFKRSLESHMPELVLDEIKIEAPKGEQSICYSASANTAKLDAWVDYVNSLKEDAILADCDMVMLKAVEGGFDKDFDVAYTKKVRQGGCPMNGGIMLVKPTEGAREFFKLFKEANDRMLFEDRQLLRKWQNRYPGMNQAAFGMIYEGGLFKGKLLDLPTQVWNAVDSDWAYVDERTIFLHVKGSLRDMVLKGLAPRGSHALAMKLWYKEAGDEERVKAARKVTFPKRGTKAKILDMLRRQRGEVVNNGN